MPAVLSASDERRCVGRFGIGGCRFDPVFRVAGDGACIYHLVAVVRLRLAEVAGARVEVAAWSPAEPDPDPEVCTVCGKALITSPSGLVCPRSGEDEHEERYFAQREAADDSSAAWQRDQATIAAFIEGRP